MAAMCSFSLIAVPAWLCCMAEPLIVVACHYCYPVRYKIKESLAQLSHEAQQELRTYIIPTVLHKVRTNNNECIKDSLF